MMSMTLSAAANAIHGTLLGDDKSFASVSTDTRSIRAGDLFIALQGPNFDAHDYVQQAGDNGAVAAMVHRQVNTVLPQLLVDDTRIGLGQLATAWRKQVNPKVVALTGSNGKTTLKEMLYAIVSAQTSVLATKGNLNNDIGVPLTLLRLQEERIAVIEMGANHVGEIDYLSRMALPDIAILNNAGTAHLGEFGSEENIALAKAEILNGLNDNGIFIFNADSRWVGLWQELADAINSLTFGTTDGADYHSPQDSYRLQWHDNGFVACFDVLEKNTGEQQAIELQLAGAHNRMNALAAITAARCLDVDLAIIAKALAGLKPVAGRLCPRAGANGQVLVDDTYNANPDSVQVAIDVLKTAPGRRILVLGDLAELGDSAAQLHADIGRAASLAGLDALYSCGQLSRQASEQFTGVTRHFDSQRQLIDELMQTGTGDVLLIKGSRSAAMERVVQALLAQEAVSC
ncbi:MAG: UDP-N-acetylmuramoyl-tripeptide--D-alanyl-D-alanine ligase [Chromatiales bacterium]|jgi:UDP-N-acetylmuramoyl-tripeptide--D-alanyl-D-alanine ligase